MCVFCIDMSVLDMSVYCIDMCVFCIEMCVFSSSRVFDFDLSSVIILSATVTKWVFNVSGDMSFTG